MKSLILLKVVYTDNGGENTLKLFSSKEKMAPFVDQLISKYKSGDKIEIKAFQGPMDLMKILVNGVTQNLIQQGEKQT